MAQGRGQTTKRRSGKGHHRPSRHNQKVLLRWVVLILALIAVIVLAVRCAAGAGSTDSGAATVDETRSRVEFTKKGALTVTSVETFDQSYYDEAELREFMDSEIAAYKESGGSGVSNEDLTVADGTATLVMHYDSASDYDAFNDQEMFCGTLQAAEDAGYDLSGLSGQTNAQDESETYGEGTARELSGNTVIVITEPLDILTATDILYASDNLTVQGDTYATANADAVSTSDPAIVILAAK